MTDQAQLKETNLWHTVRARVFMYLCIHTYAVQLIVLQSDFKVNTVICDLAR